MVVMSVVLPACAPQNSNNFSIIWPALPHGKVTRFRPQDRCYCYFEFRYYY
jgi:hypothetical protein